MTKYREILRLNALGLSSRAISESCNVSRNTVSKVLSGAKNKGVTWAMVQSRMLSDVELEKILLDKPSRTQTDKKLPDFEYVRKELLRNGVNKKLLWVEYCEECRLNGDDPLMYSQFCYYIQQLITKRAVGIPQN